MTPGTVPRWGLPAFAVAWMAGLVAAVLGVGVYLAVTGVDVEEDTADVLLASLLAQGLGAIVAVWLISVTRGRGSPRADFGFQVRAADWPWLLNGALIQVGATILLAPLSVLAPDEAQGVVEAFEDAAGPEVVIFAIAVVVVAPVVEELLFRGLLLRALMRRTTAGWAVVGSACAFAGVHLLDPSIGTVIAIPAFLVLGLVAGDQAVRTRSLSRPILLHAGFNLLTALTIVAL